MITSIVSLLSGLLFFFGCLTMKKASVDNSWSWLFLLGVGMTSIAIQFMIYLQVR